MPDSSRFLHHTPSVDQISFFAGKTDEKCSSSCHILFDKDSFKTDKMNVDIEMLD
jgi:hypothetical protein